MKATSDIEPSDDGLTRGAGLRLWLMREAMRQAEAHLSYQVQALAALEARATALIGWAIAAATALVSALIVGRASYPAVAAAACALVPCLAAAWYAVRPLRPGPWCHFGDPIAVVDSGSDNEADELEAIARGLGIGIARNEERLKASGAELTLAIKCLVAAPVVGAMGFAAAHTWLLIPGLSAWAAR